jgi:hypothetical protein
MAGQCSVWRPSCAIPLVIQVYNKWKTDETSRRSENTRQDNKFSEIVRGMIEDEARTYCENYALGEALESELKKQEE